MADDFLGAPQPRRAAPRTGARSWRGVKALIAALSFAVLIGSGVAWATYKNFTASIPRGAPVPPLAAGTKDPDGGSQNILLIGSDSRAGATAAELKALGTQDDGGSINADTMLVLHVPADGAKASVVSIPRDSWVTIPGYGEGKINAAYPDGYNAAKSSGADEIAAESAGIALTIKTISALTGLHIDHYMQVDLLGFYRISNAIGGVTVCLNAPAQDGYSGIDLPAGVSVIQGSQALAFVRQRHGLPGGDLDRIKRQQYFLASAFHKIETAGVLLNPFKLHNLMTAVGSSLLIDPGLNLLSLAQQFENLSTGNITFTTLPNDGAQTIYPDGVLTSIVQVDTAAIPSFIRVLEGKPADPALAGAKATAPSAVTVDVLNGTAVIGLAGRNATALKALGFHTNDVDSTDPSTATSIEYPAGQQGQAKALSAVVPGAALVLTSSVKRVTLVLGTDGRQVKGLAAEPLPGSSPSTASGSSTAPAAHSSGTSTATAAKSSAPTPPAGLGCIN